MKLTASPWRRLLLLAFLIGAACVAVRLAGVDYSGITKEQFREKVRSFGHWGPVLYIAVYVLRPLVFFPAALLSASAGFIWGLEGFIYVQIGAHLSSTLEFFTARCFARDAVSKRLKGRALGLDEAIRKRGFLTVFLVRLIPNVAWDIQNLCLGLTSVRFKDYFFGTFLGILPGTFALVYFGASVVEILSDPKNFGALIAATLLIAGLYLLGQRLRRKREAILKNGGDA